MGAPNITGAETGSVYENSGQIVTGQLTDSGNNVANTWSISAQGQYGSASIDSNGVWSYDLNDLNATVQALDPGQTLTDVFTVHLSDAFGSDNQQISVTIHGVPCLTAGTLVATEAGQRPVETIRPPERVWTRDHGLQPVRWAGSRRVSLEESRKNRRYRPVRIEAGALGPGLPERTLWVSRQHRMLVSSGIAQCVFGSRDVLIAAIRLTVLDAIRIEQDPAPVTYVHLLFDRHEVIFAEGAPTESLLPGPQALAAWSSAEAEAIAALAGGVTRSGSAATDYAIPSLQEQKRIVAQLVEARGFARRTAGGPAHACR
jgi:VCBS repeat-containing protein